MSNYPFKLWEAASRQNVLPLTSSCNLRCVFCSNAQNPRGVRVYAVPPLPLPLVKRLLPCLDPRRKIVIGEAATRLSEGEPFTHPDAWQVLAAVRESFPLTMLQITTNGTLLDSAGVRRLARLQPLEVNLSLNSATPAGRRLLMNDGDPRRVLGTMERLAACGITYHGSLVAMPHLVGWNDLEATCRCLNDRGAATIRIFLPGFTRRAVPWLRFDPEAMYRHLSLFADAQQVQLRAPLLLEPFLAGGGERLQAEIAGTGPGSPAARAGLRRGDVIRSVNGRRVHGRVDAFGQIRRFRRPVLELAGPGPGPSPPGVFSTAPAGRRARRLLVLGKSPGGAGGVVMRFDLDWRLVDRAAQLIRHHRAGRVLVLTSAWGLPWLRLALPAWEQAQRGPVRLAAVANRVFGGSIAAAGLLTTFDFGAALRRIIEETGHDFELILLPGIAFDGRGRDLLGRPCIDLQAFTRGAIRRV